MMWLRNYRVVASLLVVVLAFKLMTASFHWMNLPSDAAFDGGLAVLLITVVLLTAVMRSLWRRTR